VGRLPRQPLDSGCQGRPWQAGRLAISRADARRLFAERREVEARNRARQAAAELQAIEQDRQWPSYMVVCRGTGSPADVLLATAMLQDAHDAQLRRMSVLQEVLGQSSRTFHPIHNVPDENGS
jgi:hypothetical protein